MPYPRKKKLSATDWISGRRLGRDSTVDCADRIRTPPKPAKLVEPFVAVVLWNVIAELPLRFAVFTVSSR